MRFDRGLFLCVPGALGILRVFRSMFTLVGVLWDNRLMTEQLPQCPHKVEDAYGDGGACDSERGAKVPRSWIHWE